MIARDPLSRPSFAEVLDAARDTAFPESFYTFLHSYVTSINETSSPSLFSRPGPPKAAAAPAPALLAVASGGPESWTTIPSDSDHRIERIWAEFDSVEPILVEERVEDTITELRPKGGSLQQTNRPFLVRFEEYETPNQYTLTVIPGCPPCRGPYTQPQYPLARSQWIRL